MHMKLHSDCDNQQYLKSDQNKPTNVAKIAVETQALRKFCG